MTPTDDNPFKVEKEKQFCPKCHSELQIRSGQTGAFWGCTSYPQCDYSKPLSNHSEVQVMKILEDVCCPECEGDLAVKSGKYGMFIGCMNYPECGFTVKEDDDDDYVPVSCPVCSDGELHMRASKKGKNFYACNQYPKCDYLVNHKPVARACSSCDWPLMIESTNNDLSCPNCGIHLRDESLAEEPKDES